MVNLNMDRVPSQLTTSGRTRRDKRVREIIPGRGDHADWRYVSVVWDGRHYRAWLVALDWTRYLLFDSAAPIPLARLDEHVAAVAREISEGAPATSATAAGRGGCGNDICKCAHSRWVHDSDWGLPEDAPDDAVPTSCAVEGCECAAFTLDPGREQDPQRLYLDGVEVVAFIRGGKLHVEIDTYTDGAPQIHEANGEPRVGIHVNDGLVYPAPECTCGMERRSDLHSGDCAVVR